MEKENLGFVLISSAPNYQNEILEKIKKIKEVLEAHTLFGEWDIIAKIKIDNFRNLEYLVRTKIENIDAVLETKTFCVRNGPTSHRRVK